MIPGRGWELQGAFLPPSLPPFILLLPLPSPDLQPELLLIFGWFCRENKTCASTGEGQVWDGGAAGGAGQPRGREFGVSTGSGRC